MSERPIIFSAPMVRAILGGRKTQTRRVLRRPTDHFHATYTEACIDDAGALVWWDRSSMDNRRQGRLPFAVGDSLWVREACRAEELSRPQFERPATAKERALLKRMTVIECSEDDGADGVRYLADDAWRKIENTPEAGEAWSALFHYRGRGKGRVGNTVPPIHMPRWASRITLRVTEVRVQRLQEISEEDAKAEGVESLKSGRGYYSVKYGKAAGHFGVYHDFAREAFEELWCSIHGPGSWDENPWVAAVTFERVP